MPICTLHSFIGQPAYKDNARMIAAAPELYEALLAAIRYQDKLGHHQEWVDAARAVLAKIQG